MASTYYNNYRGQNKPSNKKVETANDIFAQKTFQKSWIEDGADESLPVYAEFMGRKMAEKGLSSSKIRSIYGEIKRIQMGQFEKEKSAFYLLRPKVAYAVGRDRGNIGLELFKLVFDESARYVISDKTFHNFACFVEAVLAYHRSYSKKND